jgi:pectate lyase
MNFRKDFSRITLLALVLGASWPVASEAGQVAHVWKSGAGNWDDVARWGGAPFGPTDAASIEGDGEVLFDHGDVTLNQLEVGSYHKAKSTLIMEGGMLTLPHYLRIGEMTGASGRFIQRGGDIRTVEIFVAAGNVGDGTDRHARGELEIRGGSIVARHLTLGWGMGSTGRIHIVGSAAKPVLVLDYFWIGVRGEAEGTSDTEMAFDIDGGGVTPIEVCNPKSSAVALIDNAAKSTCHLHVSLLEAPPGGDISLLRLPIACHGVFTDLPEGSPVRASFGGRTYEWTITYCGGPKQSDVVLTHPQIVAEDGQRTPYEPGRSEKAFEVTRVQIDAGLRDLITRESAAEPPIDPTAQRAFPGVEGFGAFAKGGRGGRVLFVTTLDDSGPGSLRAAIETKGPRTILFRVGGVIQLKSTLTIREPYVTIAGQTAPGDGICVRADNGIHGDTFVLNNTHDVIVRFLRAQSGKGPGPARYDDGGDCISVYDSTDFIIDHCSTHFGTDETLSVTGSSDRYTVQWSIISEGLNYEKHSMASLLGGGRSTWHHNLFAHNGSRNPNFAGEPTCDFRNNVLYDWGHTSGQGGFTQLNYAGNYLRPGPSTVQKPRRFVSGNAMALAGSLYLSGNILEGVAETTADNALGVDHERDVLSATPFPMVPFVADSAEVAFERVLRYAGATRLKRDAADERVIADVRAGTGKIIASQEEVGGWPTYAAVRTAPMLTETADGIPAEWMRQHDLDPATPLDQQPPPSSGYTWLEVYLHEFAGKATGP